MGVLYVSRLYVNVLKSAKLLTRFIPKLYYAIGRLSTYITGIFDVTDGTLEVYIDVPENSKPVHVFHIYET